MKLNSAKAILAGGLAMGLASGCAAFSHKNASRYDVVSQDIVCVDQAYPPSIVELSFDSHGSRLNGHIYLANGPGPHPTAILLHGYPGTERNLDIAQALRRAGVNVLFFHYRGAWGSEGEFSVVHVVEDVATALDVLRTRAQEYRVDPERMVLIGHSMGGFAALQGAAQDNGILCVAGIAAADFGSDEGVFNADSEAGRALDTYSDTLQMLQGWSGDKFRVEINQNREAFSLTGLAPKLAGKSILLVAGENDQAVPPPFFHDRLVAAYSELPQIDMTATTIPGDHAFSWSRVLLTRTVVDWTKSCVD